MADMQKIRQRYAKQREARYGLSVVWFLPETACWTLEGYLAEVAGDGLLRFPRPHASIVRCQSVSRPVAPVGVDALTAALRATHGDAIVPTAAALGDDGVLRLQCAPVRLRGIERVGAFYAANGLTYEIIREPWVSLGQVNPCLPDARARAEALAARLRRTPLPLLRLCARRLWAVAYEDILLCSHTTLVCAALLPPEV